jgi:hypothetical protein
MDHLHAWRGLPDPMDQFEATAPLRARPWFGHAFGLVGFLLALWLRLEIGAELIGYPFITFFPVVVLTTFLGGLRPGLLCAGLSGLASCTSSSSPTTPFPWNGRAAPSPWASTSS